MAQWLACWAHNPKVRGSKPRFAMRMGLLTHVDACRIPMIDWNSQYLSAVERLASLLQNPKVSCGDSVFSRPSCYCVCSFMNVCESSRRNVQLVNAASERIRTSTNDIYNDEWCDAGAHERRHSHSIGSTGLGLTSSQMLGCTGRELIHTLQVVQ